MLKKLVVSSRNFSLLQFKQFFFRGVRNFRESEHYLIQRICSAPKGKFIQYEQLNIMMQRTANENAACLRRICKRSDQPKIERVQTESQIATVDSCFDLVGSLQHGVASCEVFAAGRLIFTNPLYMQLVMTSDELKSKSLPIGQCHMQNAWQGTIGKIQNIASLPR